MAQFDWIQIKTDYLKDSNMSLVQVAEKYKVNTQHLYNIAAKGKWRETKDEILKKTEERLNTILPETIAQVKVRHARLGRALQSSALKAIVEGRVTPKNFQEVSVAARVGAQIERDALGLNDKQVQDEIYTKFSQFMFIFSLAPDELRRFIKSANPGGQTSSGDAGQSIPRIEAQTGSG